MHQKRFFDEVKKSAGFNRIWMPGRKTARTWPLCMTCGREVEAAELKNVNSTSVEIWARCHGAEDYYKLNFPYRIDGDPLEDPRANEDIKAAILAFSPFDPTQVPR